MPRTPSHRGLSPATLDRGARTLRALGHPLRLRLVELLARHAFDAADLAVGDLADATGRSIAVVSSHLRKLHAAGLLSRRRRGKSVHYRIAHPHVARVLHLLHQEQYAANTFQGGEAI